MMDKSVTFCQWFTQTRSFISYNVTHVFPNEHKAENFEFGRWQFQWKPPQTNKQSHPKPNIVLFGEFYQKWTIEVCEVTWNEGKKKSFWGNNEMWSTFLTLELYTLLIIPASAWRSRNWLAVDQKQWRSTNTMTHSWKVRNVDFLEMKGWLWSWQQGRLPCSQSENTVTFKKSSALIIASQSIASCESNHERIYLDFTLL